VTANDSEAIDLNLNGAKCLFWHAGAGSFKKIEGICGSKAALGVAHYILYMHDTIETFSTRIDELRAEWVTNIRSELHANNVRTVQSAASTLFGAVTDPIRAASQIVQGRILTPDSIRETCNLGFSRIFKTRGQ
jgi:hypothetical protein